MITTQVLIVGGGPVGMTLALLLSRWGIKSILVNDKKETTSHPKLDVVNGRSMEIFRQLAIADKIRANGNPLQGNNYVAFASAANGLFFNVLKDEKHLIYQSTQTSAQNIQNCQDGSLPLENMQRIPQMHLEPVLLQEVQNDASIDCRFGWKMFGFEQDKEGVTSLIHELETGKNQTVRANYIVGCDGPNSKVRNFLNIDYDGTRNLVGELYIIHFQSDEVKNLFPNAEPYWHTWICRPHFGALLVSPNVSKNDYILHRPFAPQEGEEVEEIVYKALGKKMNLKIIQSGAWRPQFLVAEHFGYKRAFIAGDATHQYMPTGGLGMNTGVTEAHNLAWKIAATLQGWGGENLLKSYEAERLPVAMRNRNHVKKCSAAAFEIQQARTAYMLKDTPEAEEVRQKLKVDFEQKITRLYESFGIELGYRYTNSPVICKETANEPPNEERNYFPTTYVGARLPSVFTAEGEAVFDSLNYTHFTLLDMSDDPNGAEKLQKVASEAGLPLKIVKLKAQYIRELYEKKYVLVRPDQHIAWRGNVIENEEFIIHTISGTF